MKDWIMELCPEIAGWQADLIVEEMQKLVIDEREACAMVCDRLGDEFADTNAAYCAHAIRARGQG